MPRDHGVAVRAIRIDEPEADEGSLAFELLDSDAKRISAIAANTLRSDMKLSVETIRELTPYAKLNDVKDIDVELEVARQFVPYNSYIENTDPAEHDPTLLLKLGRLLTVAPPSDKQKNSALPAAYTYLGQFIAHDISRMEVKRDDSGDYNFRTPSLDLDSVFGAIESRVEIYASSVDKFGTLALGQTEPNSRQPKDLPRAPCGEAQIADGRNDHNLAVAQFHVMVSQFYRQMLHVCGNNEVQAKILTIRHFQHVVIYDYLKNITDPGVYRDVICHGPRIVRSAPFLVPREFALACFRVGHSMIQSFYKDWSPVVGANVIHLLDNTHADGHGALLSATYHEEEERRLGDKWPILWESFIDLNTQGSVLNHANSIGGFITKDLGNLPLRLLKELFTVQRSGIVRQTLENGHQTGNFNLAVQTLLRGQDARLPDAQTLHSEMQKRLGESPLPEPISESEIANTQAPELESFLSNGEGRCFTKSTPLWFYCLRESAVEPSMGNRLGPLGSRVVAETIYRAIKEDPDGILSPQFDDAKFQPLDFLLNSRRQFGLAEFIQHATKQP